MADKIDNTIFQSMLTSADSDAIQTWQEMNLDKPTDLGESEQALSIIKGLMGLGSGEVYNEEGEVIAMGGSPPDLAFSPLVTKSSIKNIANKLKDLPVKGAKTVIDKIASKVLSKPTKEFITNAKNRLFEDLGSHDAWQRWQNTMGAENILGYKAYRSQIKKSLDLFNDKDLTLMDRALSEGDMATLGRYFSEGSKKGMVEINPYKNITRDLHSTAVHEYAHKAQLAPDYAPTRLTGGSVYEGGEKVLDIAKDMPYLGNQRPIKFVNNSVQYNRRHKGFEWEFKYWDKIKPYFTDKAKDSLGEIKQWAGIDPNIAPKDIKYIRYLLRPREISARIAQLREGSAPAGTMQQLKEILTDEGIEYAKKNLWGVAGIGAFDEMIDSSSDPADNLFKDSN